MSIRAKINNLKMGEKPAPENKITDEILEKLKEEYGFNSIVIIGVEGYKVSCGADIHSEADKHAILHALDLLVDQL